MGKLPSFTSYLGTLGTLIRWYTARSWRPPCQNVQPDTPTVTTSSDIVTHGSSGTLFYEMTEAEREDTYNADTETDNENI